MSIKMGPALSFRGCDDGRWNLSAIVVADADPGVLTLSSGPIVAELLWQQGPLAAYRFKFALPMSNASVSHSYQVGGRTYDIEVPAIDQAPRMAYASCNGFSSLKLMKSVDDNNYLWTSMARKHGLPPVPGAPPQVQNGPEVKDPSPYHLLLLGGDQVYADSLWETNKLMEAWLKLSWADGNLAKATVTMRRQLDDFYFKLYTERWNQPAVAQMLARVPSIAMWDDHDLIDGWGSYPPERQYCEVYGAIWQSAAKAFAIFQQHLADGERREGTIGATADADWWKQPATPAKPVELRQGAFSFAYKVGGLAILALDMRSQRTSETQVIGAAHWAEIYSWIKANAHDTHHLLVMSSIPVVYPGFDTLETLLKWVPAHQDLEDDLRDHWNSVPHKDERLRLVRNLLDAGPHVRSTLLSGDVHVAALGVIESARIEHVANPVINQLISSGIVHPGPGGVVVFALQHIFDSDDEIERGIVGRLIPIRGKPKFIGKRNFLSIEPDLPGVREKPRLWCNWIVEGERFPYTKVVMPA